MSIDDITASRVGAERRASTPTAPTNDHKALDAALIDLRQKLFQAMGIVRLARRAVREPHQAETEAGPALDAAHSLLAAVADRLQSTNMVLAGGSHGEY
jgi:hypothetical protein